MALQLATEATVPQLGLTAGEKPASPFELYKLYVLKLMYWVLEFSHTYAEGGIFACDLLPRQVRGTFGILFTKPHSTVHFVA